MKCLFVYNPNSGKGSILKHIDFVVNSLKTKYEIVDSYATKSGEDAIRIAREACGKYDLLVFSGGDGTFNDMITGIGQNENRPILGYIPTGTVNDISRNLKITKRIKKAVQVILDGHVMNHDVGMINDKYFMYVCGIGTFTGVSYRTAQHLKRKLGKIAYAVDGIKDIVKPQITQITIETSTQKLQFIAPLMLIVNSISVGGVVFNRDGHQNDGHFDVIIVKNGINKGLGNIMKLMLFGFRKKNQHKHFTYLKVANMKVTVDDITQWCLDGEAGPKGEAIIKNLHDHIQIIVPKKKK